MKIDFDTFYKVHTSAFALGIDQEDVRKVLHIGCPPSIDQMETTRLRESRKRWQSVQMSSL